MVDKHRAQAALAGAAVAVLWAGFNMVAVLFAEPPPTRREVLKALAQKALAVVAGATFAMLSAPWATEAANWMLGLSPLKVGFKVDSMTAAAVVSGLTVVLIADPTARQRLLTWLKAKIPGVSQ